MMELGIGLYVSFTLKVPEERLRAIFRDCVDHAAQGEEFWDLVVTTCPKLEQALELIDSDEAYIEEVADNETADTIWKSEF